MGGLPSKNYGSWPVIMQAFPPKSKFSTDQIPDLTGRVALVTGGSGGIGLETVKVLLQHNAKVYLAARSRTKSESAIASLKETTGKEAIFFELDLSSLASVKKSAEEFLSKERELHILFNNAGVMSSPMDHLTPEGLDLQWGTNVVGHWYFTELLMSALIAGAQSSPDHHARVVTTSSSGAYMTTVDFDTLKDGPKRRAKMDPLDLYAQSKFGNAIVARQIAKRYAEKGIISITLNPGNIESDLMRHKSKLFQMIAGLGLYPVSLGALTQLYAGTMPEALNMNGEFLIPFARLGRCRPEMYDEEYGEKVWKWIEDFVKEHQPS